MKQSELNHLRRLLGWVRCEIGQSPDELVATIRELAAAGIRPEDPDGAHRRLVEAHDRARSVPKYVREAVKALEGLTRPGEAVPGTVREVQRIDP